MITVVLLAKNEEVNLRQVLPELKWADKIIVVDDNSSDDTVKVSLEFGAKIISRQLNGDFSAQRNFGLNIVKSGWVLFLDPDERLSKLAVKEILEIVSSDKVEDSGFAFRRMDYFFDKPLKFGETRAIWLTRLAKVGSGVFTGKVHENWNIGNIVRLNGVIRHHSHDSIAQLFGVVKVYARIRAKELNDQGENWDLWKQLVFPFGKFMWTFVWQLGFLDGWRGLVMCLAMSWHSFLVRWYQWDLPWLKRPIKNVVARYLLVLPWLLLPFGQLTRAELSIGGAVYGFEVFMLLAVVWMGCLRIVQFNKWHWPLWFKSWGLFSLVLLISWLASPFVDSQISSIFYWFRWMLYGGFLWASWEANRSEILRVSLHGLIRYVGYSLLCFGVLQYLVMPDMRWLYWFGWDDHYYRMVGTLFDPNYFGLMSLLMGWWIVNNEQGKTKYAGMTLAGLAVVASYSRVAYLLAGILLVYKYWGNKGFIKRAAAGLLILITVFVILPKPGGEGVNLFRLFSINSRLQSWQQALDWIQKYPILGIGYNYYPAAISKSGSFGQPYHPSAPDSSWLYIWVTSGLVGLGLYVNMLVGWWKNINLNWIKVSLLIILVHSVTNNSFFYPWVLLWWWLLLLQNEEISILKN